MTLDELIAAAREIDGHSRRFGVEAEIHNGALTGKQISDLASAILALLTAESPGLEPLVVRNGGIGIPASWATYVSAEEARGMAVMLLRAGEVVAGG